MNADERDLVERAYDALCLVDFTQRDEIPGHVGTAAGLLAFLLTRAGRLDRMFREYLPGERVRANCDILYGDGGEVAEGEVGTVERRRFHQRVAGVALVHWDRLGQSKATSCESLDPEKPNTEAAPCVSALAASALTCPICRHTECTPQSCARTGVSLEPVPLATPDPKVSP